MTIVFQSSPTKKKVSDPSRLRVWTSPLTLSSLLYLLSLLVRKYPLTQLRLTSRLLYACCRLVSHRLSTQTLPLLHQLAHNSQSLHLRPVIPKILKHSLHLIPFYLTFDPFSRGLITSNFNPIILLLDVNIAVNFPQIMHAEQRDPVVTNIYNIVSNQNSVNGK